MKKLFLAVAVCALTLSSLNAQIVKGAEAQTKKGPYETNRFFDNIFFGVGGGVNYYQGEQDKHLKFEDRLAPDVNAYLGKWFTPSFGVRIGYNGIKAYGFYHDVNNPNGNVFIVKDYDYGKKQEMKFHYVHADLLWNISNAIGGYREDRFVDIAPYLGVGYAWNGTKHKVDGSYHSNNEIGLTLGIYTMFRICSALDLTLDLSQTYVHEAFDDDEGHSMQEYIGMATIGIAYQFRTREFSRAHAPVDVTPYNNKIKELDQALAAANNKIAQLQKDIAAANNKPAKEVVVEKKAASSAPFAVFFPIGKSQLSQSELLNLEGYVKNTIKANPDHVFTVTGSADSATGSKATNDRLGKARMQKVYDLLVNKFGIDASKLEKKSIGGTDKYGAAKLNRCVVIE